LLPLTHTVVSTEQRRHPRLEANMTSWTVHPHGPLTEVAPGLWHVQGTLPKFPARTMAVYRLVDGRLWVHSAICLDAVGMEALRALGPIGVVVIPNAMHRYDAARWRARFPEATFVCPADAREEVETVVPIDGTCESLLPELGVGVRPLAGWAEGELAYELPLSDGHALIFCDCLFNLKHSGGWMGWLFRLIGSSGFFGTTALGRWFFMHNRSAWRAWLQTESERPGLQAILVAHGMPIVEDCTAALARAAGRL
jgi:hypothetical protein